MDSPTIATTQAACILSALESANGHDSRGGSKNHDSSHVDGLTIL